LSVLLATLRLVATSGFRKRRHMTAHGCAASGATGHLPLPEWTTILTAGRPAEQLFNCRAHHGKWLRDYGIGSRLDQIRIRDNGTGIPPG
jgi:hypothetical protein